MNLMRLKLAVTNGGFFQSSTNIVFPRLALYPNQMINGHCYISLYLATAKSSVPSLRSVHSGVSAPRSLLSIYNGISDGEDVYATFRLFVFDQKQQKYLTVEADRAGTLSLFDRVTTEVGFAKFLPRDTFELPSEGYLLNDCCTFGAEVFVNTSGRTRYGESLSRMHNSILSPPFRYDLVKFSSQFGLEHLCPNLIIFGERKWQLCVYPKGYGQHKDISLSLYLRSADDLYTLPSVYVEFRLRVVDRAFNLHHIERTGKHWFLSSDNTFEKR
ncbi:hypothetical protein GBA52_007821 [Prunus armeniaca]|nr:hypothetical protein GBA52_007821 [Prunus armeniaca]